MGTHWREEKICERGSLSERELIGERRVVRQGSLLEKERGELIGEREGGAYWRKRGGSLLERGGIFREREREEIVGGGLSESGAYLKIYCTLICKLRFISL